MSCEGHSLVDITRRLAIGIRMHEPTAHRDLTAHTNHCILDNH